MMFFRQSLRYRLSLRPYDIQDEVEQSQSAPSQRLMLMRPWHIVTSDGGIACPLQGQRARRGLVASAVT